MNNTSKHPRFPWLGFALVMLLALIVRFGVLWQMYDNLAEDRDMYRALAHTLATKKVYSLNVVLWPSYIYEETGERIPAHRALRPTAYRPPLYPVLLSMIGGGESPNGISSARAFQLHFVLGLSTVALSILLAWQIGLGNGSLVAGVLVACDPVLLFWSTFVMTETLATFLCVVVLVGLCRFSVRPTIVSASLCGVASGFAMLCRPTFLAFVLLTVAAFVVTKISWRMRGLSLIAFVVALGAVLAPWTLRNYRLFHRPVFATTHGGYTLLLGNNEFFYEYVREGRFGRVWDASELHTLWESETGRQRSEAPEEVFNDNRAYVLAFTAIRKDPIGFALSCFVRIGRLWNPLPYQLEGQTSLTRDLVRYLIALWYLAVYVLAIGGIVSIGRKVLQTPWLWGILLCFSFTVVHTFYWSNIRMRAPLMPFVCILAAVGAQFFVTRFRRRKQSS